MLLAAVVVTWMLFWMRRQSTNLRGELQAAVDRVLSRGHGLGPRRPGLHRGHPRGGRDGALPRRPGDLGRRRAPGASSSARSSASGSRSLIGWGFYRGSRAIDLRRVLPLDRDRPRLHRGRPAVPRRPRVHRDRRDRRGHRHRQPDGLRHQRRPVARRRDRPVPAGDLRLQRHARRCSTFVVHVAYVVAILAALPPARSAGRRRPSGPRRSAPDARPPAAPRSAGVATTRLIVPSRLAA